MSTIYIFAAKRSKMTVKISNKLTRKAKEYNTYELTDGLFFISIEYDNFFGFKAFPKLIYRLIERGGRHVSADGYL